MLVGMVLGGLRRVVARMGRMAVGGMRVVCCLLVMAGIVVLRSFTMMVGCVLVVLGGGSVMLSTFVSGHDAPPFLQVGAGIFCRGRNRPVTDFPPSRDCLLLVVIEVSSARQ
jgi:hypothetical protein